MHGDVELAAQYLFSDATKVENNLKCLAKQLSSIQLGTAEKAFVEHLGELSRHLDHIGKGAVIDQLANYSG